MADLKFPENLKYAKSDEWVKVDGDVVTIGISDFAQDQLNDGLQDGVGVGELLDGLMQAEDRAIDLTLFGDRG